MFIYKYQMYYKNNKEDWQKYVGQVHGFIKGKYTWFCLIGAQFWVNPVNGSENNFGQ